MDTIEFNLTGKGLSGEEAQHRGLLICISYNLYSHISWEGYSTEYSKGSMHNVQRCMQ